MYNEFYGFSKDPFLIVPDPNYLYMSPKHEEAIARLVYGIKERRAIMLLTGEVGAGKTTLIRYIADRLPKSFHSATIFSSSLDASSLLRMIVAEFKLPAEPAEDKSALIKKLQTHLENLTLRKVRGILFIDEAQNLPLDSLEEIRMLSNFQANNHSLVQIILVGQPELRARMRDPRCLQIAQRIALNYHIAALNPAETYAYIRYRLQKSGGQKELFSADALEMVFRLSRGIPRMINLVCDSALIYGFAEEKCIIDSTVVANAARQLDLMGLVSPPKQAEAAAAAAPAAMPVKGKDDATFANAGNVEKHLGHLVTELRQETRKFREQTDALRNTALKLSTVLERLLVKNPANPKKVQIAAAKQKFLTKLINEHNAKNP